NTFIFIPTVFFLKKHGDITLEDKKISFCNDLFMMGGHTGTHLDAVAHVACNNRIYNNVDVTELQDYQEFPLV
ncbi:MAG: cyclase family protein, partial [Desulfobacterales bacterium]